MGHEKRLSMTKTKRKRNKQEKVRRSDAYILIKHHQRQPLYSTIPLAVSIVFQQGLTTIENKHVVPKQNIKKVHKF